MKYQLSKDLLDNSDDESFDNLTQLATHLLKVPVSLVSVIDIANDRQFFKSQTGLKEPWASKKETPLSHSFCQYVAHQDAMFCVEDAREHVLVKDNLAIPDLGVVAYLGTPIRDESGRAIGAFCVISGEPRAWSVTDKETMSRLSKCVTDMIKLKAALSREDALRQEHQKLTLFLSQSLKLQTTKLVALHNDLGVLVGPNVESEISPILEQCKETADNMNALMKDTFL